MLTDTDTDPRFRVQIDRAGSILTVYLEGECDIATSEFQDRVLAAIDATVQRVTLDASGLTFCGSMGLRAMVAIREAADEVGADFTLYKASDMLRRLVEVCCLEDVLTLRC
jgi:anti-anti-sigma factor